MLHVLVLRDDDCRSCDEVVNELQMLRGEFPEMRVHERQLDQEPELAGRLGVVATPAVVVNDQLAFQGHPAPAFLLAYLRKVQEGRQSDPDAYPPEDERDPEARGQEPLGSMDPEWRGSGRVPYRSGTKAGRHS